MTDLDQAPRPSVSAPYAPLVTRLALVDGPRAVIEAEGDLDVLSAPQLREAIGELAARGKSWLVLDLSHLRFCDSAGLEVLLSGLRRARSANGDLALVCRPPHPVPRLLAMTGLDSVLPVHGTVDEALAGFRTGAPTAGGPGPSSN